MANRLDELEIPRGPGISFDAMQSTMDFDPDGLPQDAEGTDAHQTVKNRRVRVPLAGDSFVHRR